MPSGKMYRPGLKTIRGTIQAENYGDVVQELVFNYESSDRSRGWVVEGAWMWIVDPKDVNITITSNALLFGNLSTDSNVYAFNKLIDPDDNRSIAWYQKQYLCKNGGDLYIPNTFTVSGQDFLIDFDRIVTNDLYINACFLDENEIDLTPKIGYMIALREISISPGQSLLQQLKGIGQNVDN